MADFRDPWSDDILSRWDPLSRQFIDRIAGWVLRPACSVTAASDGIASSIGRAAHTYPTRVYNGYDERAAPTAVAPRSLGYFGRVDPLRQHPERLWPVLRDLRATDTPWSVDFFLSPGGGGGADIRVPEDLRQTVSVRPTLGHAIALEKMRHYEGLLMLCFEDVRGQDIVPAKVFEYAGSGRPVLVVAPSQFEARRLVESARIGIGAWESPEVVRALATLAEFQVSGAGRDSLSRATAAATVANLLKSAIDGA